MCVLRTSQISNASKAQSPISISPSGSGNRFAICACVKGVSLFEMNSLLSILEPISSACCCSCSIADKSGFISQKPICIRLSKQTNTTLSAPVVSSWACPCQKYDSGSGSLRSYIVVVFASNTRNGLPSRYSMPSSVETSRLLRNITSGTSISALYSLRQCSINAGSNMCPRWVAPFSLRSTGGLIFLTTKSCNVSKAEAPIRAGHSDAPKTVPPSIVLRVSNHSCDRYFGRLKVVLASLIFSPCLSAYLPL